MRIVRLAALLAVLALVGSASASSADPGAPTGLHAFVLRADEPRTTSFSDTPAFAWTPVPGALHYEFQLSISNTFRDNAVIFSDLTVSAPVEAPGITLPWITGSPHSLYARVRAITTGGATAWSANYGFDMVPPPPPAPLPGYPGLLRWTPVTGASRYEIWLIDAGKREFVSTNVLDEREFYTFHLAQSWIGTVRWRIRALHVDSVYGGTTGTSRYNGIPAVQYGAWSPVYSSSNPAPSNGPIKLLGTVSDVFSDGSAGSPAHRLMPAFLWSGNAGASGISSELFRVYAFSDRQCLNPVFTGSVVGGSAYAPRPYGSLILPISAGGLASARSAYLADGTEPPGYMADGSPLLSSAAPNEDRPHVSPQESVPGAPGENSSGASSGSGSSSSSSGSGPSRPSPGSLAWSGDFGAPVDLWDTDWPSSGYYWTVVPVAAVAPGFLETNVAAPGAAAGNTVLPVVSAQGFQVGDAITIGSGGSGENAAVAGVAAGQLTLSAKLTKNHGPGETVVRTGGSLVYVDEELPQDVCAAGRVARFGIQSEPSLTAEGDLFATGLSSDGRLTSALHTTAFYGEPLVSWTPALGALAYEVQWSKTQYPFVPEVYAPSNAKGFMDATTSAVLPVGPGVWWYRVRGYDYSLPTGVQQMAWSEPAKIVVAATKLAVLPGAKPTRLKVVGGTTKKTSGK